MRGNPGRLFPAEMSRECGGHPWAATGLGGGGGLPPRSRAAFSVAVGEKQLGARVQERSRQRRKGAGAFAPSAQGDTRCDGPPIPCPLPGGPKSSPGAGKGGSTGGSSEPRAAACPAKRSSSPHPAPPGSRVGSAGSAGAAAPPAGNLAPARPRRRRRRAGRGLGRAGRDAQTRTEHIHTPVLPFKITSLPPGRRRRPGGSAPRRKAALRAPGGGPGSAPAEAPDGELQAQSNC